MRTFTELELKEILKKHEMWLSNESDGVKANLSDADLSGANLSGVDLSDIDLSYADLSGANLSGADLSDADLSSADLSCANLRCADLSGADLSDANLSGANLRCANLSGADLSDANLSGAKYNHLTSFFAMQCPESGSFICFKKVRNYIIKMQVTEDAKRSSATSRKCRASEVLVLEIQNLDGTKADVDEVINKNYRHDTIYKVGELTIPDLFDENRWNECSNGIHFFITREEAVQYD